jgi:hypothetical protein
MHVCVSVCGGGCRGRKEGCAAECTVAEAGTGRENRGASGEKMGEGMGRGKAGRRTRKWWSLGARSKGVGLKS